MDSNKDVFKGFSDMPITVQEISGPEFQELFHPTGKSVYSLPRNNRNLVFIDSEAIYDEIAESIGGKVVNLSKNTASTFNPFELSEAERDFNKMFSGKNMYSWLRNAGFDNCPEDLFFIQEMKGTEDPILLFKFKEWFKSNGTKAELVRLAVWYSCRKVYAERYYPAAPSYNIAV